MATADTRTPRDVFAALGGGRWVDLSVLVAESLPTWPLHMPFQRKVWNWYEQPARRGVEWKHEDPYHTAWWTIDEHTGTHFDAPTHFVPPSSVALPDAGPAGDITAEQVDLSRLRGPACVVDVRDHAEQALPGVSPAIERDAIERFERRHEHRLDAGDVVLFWSGWDERYQRGADGDRYARDVVAGHIPGWPCPSADLIGELADRGIVTLGTDGCSIGSSDNGRVGHVAGLAREMAYVESLTNLGAIPAVGAYFLFMPVKVEGASGGPGRAVAFIPPGTEGMAG